MIVAGAALFALCAVQAGKANSALEGELRDARAENAGLLKLLDAGLRGTTRAYVYPGCEAYYVGLSIPTKNGPYRLDVKRFPFGDDKDFAFRQAEELRDKINEE